MATPSRVRRVGLGDDYSRYKFEYEENRTRLCTEGRYIEKTGKEREL